MKEKMQRFMTGRYGFDELSRVIIIVSILFMLVSVFTKSEVLYLISIVILVICYLRALSRNITKRQTENRWLYGLRGAVAAWWRRRKIRKEQGKIYRFFHCPQCKQMVRVPRGRGKILITCPKCQMEFIKKS